MVDYLLIYTTRIVAGERLLWVARTLSHQRRRQTPKSWFTNCR